MRQSTMGDPTPAPPPRRLADAWRIETSELPDGSPIVELVLVGDSGRVLAALHLSPGEARRLAGELGAATG